MQREELERIVNEIRGYYDTDSTKMYPEEGRHPARTYLDGDWALREQHMLDRFPQIVGHASQIPEPGDFYTDDTTGKPLLIVRQEDGSVKAFLNICRHRAARLCDEESGRKKVFVCPYHAWSFRRDGGLQSVPRPEGFCNVEKADLGLFEMPVEVRHGLIWVVPTVGAEIDVANHLGGFDEELSSFNMDDMVQERAEILTFDMNWKFVVDGFLEVYHFAKLHQNSIAPYFHGWHSPYEARGQNGRLVGVRKAFDKVNETGPDGISTEDLLKTIALNYVLFPNTVLVWQADHFECWTAYPGETPEDCVVRVQSITTREQASEEHKPKWEKNWKILIGTVVAEDWAVSKTIQESIHAMPDDTMLFGRNEPGLQHFHTRLIEQVEEING